LVTKVASKQIVNGNDEADTRQAVDLEAAGKMNVEHVRDLRWYRSSLQHVEIILVS